jgi:hypothetical protein
VVLWSTGRGDSAILSGLGGNGFCEQGSGSAPITQSHKRDTSST